MLKFKSNIGKITIGRPTRMEREIVFLIFTAGNQYFVPIFWHSIWIIRCKKPFIYFLSLPDAPHKLVRWGLSDS